MQDTAGEAGTSLWVMFFNGPPPPPHSAVEKQDDQLEPTHSSSMRIRDVGPAGGDER